jgi:cellobiose dehydrogenase (acceptor)
LPATDTPSTDGKRYLTQVYDVVKSLLDKQNYSALTINDNPNSKDHVYGNPAYYVRVFFSEKGSNLRFVFVDSRWETNRSYGHLPEDGKGSIQFQPYDLYQGALRCPQWRTNHWRANQQHRQYVYAPTLLSLITYMRFPIVGGTGIIPLTTNGRVILSAGAFGTAKLLFQSGVQSESRFVVVLITCNCQVLVPRTCSPSSLQTRRPRSICHLLRNTSTFP